VTADTDPTWPVEQAPRHGSGFASEQNSGAAEPRTVLRPRRLGHVSTSGSRRLTRAVSRPVAILFPVQIDMPLTRADEEPMEHRRQATPLGQVGPPGERGSGC